MTRRLSRLYRGSESSIRFNLLMEGVGLLKLSEKSRTFSAWMDSLVKGIDKDAAAALNGVRFPNLERDLGKLDTFADLVARIEDHDSDSHKKQ